MFQRKFVNLFSNKKTSQRIVRKEESGLTTIVIESTFRIESTMPMFLTLTRMLSNFSITDTPDVRFNPV